MSLKTYQCTSVKVWNSVAKVLPKHLLSPDELMATASKEAGHSNFGSSTFLEPLKILVESIEDSSDLHPFGRFYVKKIFTGLLVNRLKLVDLWNRQPEILNESIQSPFIILGLPRTGTSFLFALLAQDPSHRFLSNWEATVSQTPPKGTYTYNTDPRRKLGKHLMRFQNHLAPHMKGQHAFCLDGPEECTTLLMQEFTTQALASMFNAPAYSEWLNTASHASTYSHHKRILQTLQWKYPGERWLLKSPAHIEAVENVLQTYPNANLIQLHRDPVKAVSSYASLCAAFRGICSQTIDANELGSQALSRLAFDFEHYLSHRSKCDPSRFFDIQYHDFVHNPLETVQSIYNRFELVFSTETEERMRAFLAKQRKSKSQHHYSPQDFGLTPQSIRHHFQSYIDAFDIPEES